MGALDCCFFFFCCCYTYCTNDYRRDHRHHFRLHLHHRTCYFHYFNVHFLSFFIMPLIKRPCNSPPIATALLPHVVTRSPPCSILRHDPACVAEADRSVNCSSAATATARFTAQTPFTSLFRPTSPLPLPSSMTTTSRLPLLQGALSPEGLGAGRCPAAASPPHSPPPFPSSPPSAPAHVNTQPKFSAARGEDIGLVEEYGEV